MRNRLILLPALLLLLSPVLSFAADQALPISSQDYLDALLEAQARGKSDSINTISITLAVIGIFVTISGYISYRLIRSQLKEDILNEIRETQIGGFISLAQNNYLSFKASHDVAVKRATINSAITHTELALRIAREELKASGYEKERIILIALAATNLAYYYIESSDLYSNDPDICSKHKERAQRILREWANEISAWVRSRESVKPEWYEVLESKLYVEMRTSESEFSKDNILKDIKCLLEDCHIPSAWKEETKEIWQKYGLIA